MPQRCTVCSHPETKEIEKLIVQGRPNTRIADKYGLDHQAVRYHGMNHLPAKLVRHTTKMERAHTRDLFANIQEALDEANEILREARDKGQNRLSLDAIKTILSANELFAKMMVKVKEFEATEEAREDAHASNQISQGLKTLSDDELKAYLQLQSKIYSADPDYQLDSAARMIVDAITQNGYATSDNGFDPTGQQDGTRSDRPRIRLKQGKNKQKQGSSGEDDAPEMLDDLDGLDLDDLDLTKDNVIPSEETDPEWLVKYRRRNR